MKKNIAPIATATINNATDLVALIANAKNGGQFATITAETPIAFNQFPNADYCAKMGIVMPTKKAEKEQYRFNGLPYTKRFKVAFHFDEDYDNALAKAGFTRSENGPRYTKDHFGTIAVGIPSTNNICLVYLNGAYEFDGIYLNGEKIEDAETLAYIEGYKQTKKVDPNAPQYRNVGIKNVRSIKFGRKDIAVKVAEISQEEYESIKATYCKPSEEVAVAEVA